MEKATLSTKKIIENRRARYDYNLLERYEAGIVLQGTEVKSLRAGKVSIRDSFARVEGDEIFLYDLHISPYDHGNRENHDPKRPRKLLLHKREIKKLYNSTQQSGFTIVPTRMYFSRGIAKVEIALATGKREYDKREAIKARETQQTIKTVLKDSAKNGTPSHH
ncbi:TPA: SsrA-binding protein SmpB [Candidatus Poribacteria bacterium]|nr:SsrA-binding protein SmpB [Candidatus Poribacteria bacterium]